MKLSDLSPEELRAVIVTDRYDEALREQADRVRQAVYGRDVYIRGLIEFTNYCKNNCYYCGIRRDNLQAKRYRLTKEDILACCKKGYELGFRTFVLQGGEDLHFTTGDICDIVYTIKAAFEDCAVTLSVGEKTKAEYKAYFDAGADRYLLRHETANPQHYSRLHPADLSLKNRINCLYSLKEIGYQVGSGFMVGSPWQTVDNLVEDIALLKELQPDMIGIGPYLVHKQTPFADQKNGSLYLTLRLLAILRLMFPYVLLPATTALGTLHPQGRQLGLRGGANVIMPNLSPQGVRSLYTLYENKAHTGVEGAEGLEQLKNMVSDLGYRVVVARGDVKKEIKNECM